MVYKLNENIFDENDCTIKDVSKDLPTTIPYDQIKRIMMIQDFKTDQIFIQVKTKAGKDMMIPVAPGEEKDVKTICAYVQSRIEGEAFTPPTPQTAEVSPKEEPKDEKLFKHKFSWLLLISFILGLAYLAWSAYYWGSALKQVSDSSSDLGTALGGAIAIKMVYPSLIALFIAVCTNFLAMLLRNTWVTLAAAILYVITLILFPMYWMFTIVEIILCTIAFVLYLKK